jgi:RimJ/RimL family protein N-acetyltransferase
MEIGRVVLAGTRVRLESMRAFVTNSSAGLAAGSILPFATIDQMSGRIVGSTCYLAIEPAHKRLEIGGTWITPSHKRSPVNTEAKLLQLTHCFEVLGCNRVEFKTDARNAESRAALARIGAVEEGTFRAHMVMPDGQLRSSVYFSVIASEWPEVKARLVQRSARTEPQRISTTRLSAS